MPGRRLLLLLPVLGLVGCGETLETTYGRSRGASVNGTGAVAERLREEGHAVRVALRLTSEVADWADVIVRFAPYPGPPDEREADWYTEWLVDRPGRRLVYVPRDYDAEIDYWSALMADPGRIGGAALRERAGRRRDQAQRWPERLPDASADPADVESWFAVESAPPGGPMVCERLSGPWAEGIDAGEAALVRHEALRAGIEDVLLAGDGRVLAMEWAVLDDRRVLVVASGAFLLNAALLNPARRPLAGRVVRWAAGGTSSRRIAFVEGAAPWSPPPASPSIFHLLGVSPFNWILGQALALLLAASLARAPRLGRPRAEPPSGVGRIAAHPEALGDLLARTDGAGVALAELDAYRRWRHPSAAPAPPTSNEPADHE